MVLQSEAPLVRPQGSGFLTLFSAALWIATKGHTHNFAEDDLTIWRPAYAELLGRIYAGEIKVTGLRLGEREEIPGHQLGVVIVLPSTTTPLDLIFGSEPYLTTGPLGDALHVNGRVRWSKLMVDKGDVARYWPYAQTPFEAVVETKNSDRDVSANRRAQKAADIEPPRFLVLAWDKETAVVRDPRFRFGPANSKLIETLYARYKEDLKNRLAPENHRTMRFQALNPTNQQTAEKRVNRCRKEFSKKYHAQYGQRPPHDLLIETVRGKGVRLNPATRFVDIDQIATKRASL